MKLKSGVYVDSANIFLNGGKGMDYEVLVRLAGRDGAYPLSLNAYIPYDEQRADKNPSYRAVQLGFHAKLRSLGFKVSRKTVKRFTNDEGIEVTKANADLDLAVDMLTQCDKLDRVLLVTGDGDFSAAVRALRNRGCRVEVVAFQNVSRELIEEVDLYMNGYLIPDLVPVITSEKKEWGAVGSRVRGYCYNVGDDYGFMRFLKNINGPMWSLDSRSSDSPYESAYFQSNALPKNVKLESIPLHSGLFEFTLAQPKKKAATAPFQALDIDFLGKQ